MPEVFSAEKAVKKVKKNVDVVVAEAKKMAAEMGRGNWLSSLWVLPNKVKFETQNDKEVIILVVRRHIITNLWWLMLASFLVFIPWYWDSFPLIALVEEKVRFGLSLTWYLLLGFFVLEQLLLWYYNVYIVTDERIIDVDFFDLFHKNVDVAKIKSIEEVNYRQVGTMSIWFNYGNVVAQTASEQRTSETGRELSAFTFEAVPNPDRIARVISELIDQEELESYEGRVR